ncbi:MAG: hypothetical protein IPM53_13230 [Anaerolineaceae bacterium]|nr:hypothetical protein [Anaerolineaceae bacterium]
MTKQRLLILFLLLLVASLAACTGDTFSEPTPIPPPPTSDEGVNQPAATNTPIANADATEPAAEPTPTLVATATATAEVMATAVTDPPIQAINSQPLPASSRNLLFLADGAFKRWNQANGQIETIVPGPDPTGRVQDETLPLDQFIGDVTAYSTNADGKRAVVARLLAEQPVGEPEAGLAETSHELLFVDMVSGEIWTLMPQVDNLGDFQLSPDAQQLAFAATGLDGIPDAPGSGVDFENGEPIPNNLYVMATGGGNPASVNQVHDCAGRCFAPVWHVENNLVAFADEAALWLYNIAAREPEMLLENTPYEAGMEDIGQISIYSPVAWASNGRYLLVWEGLWEGANRAVFDVPTDILVPVPDSFVYAEPFPSEISWMPDDRLLVWRSHTQSGDLTPQVELWRLNLDAAELVLEESAELSDLPLGLLGGVHLEDGRFAFALNTSPSATTNQAARQAAGTYLLTSLAETPERVNSLPPAEEGRLQSEVYFAKDGSGAVMVLAPRQFETAVFYAPTDGDFLYEVTAVLGQNPHNFEWQPEIVLP